MRRIARMTLLVCLLLFLSACQRHDGTEISLEEIELESETVDDEQTGLPSSVFVYVCGAVNCPGVYELPEGSRVYEAIESAGGFGENADVTRVNQAEILEDEEQIYVPTIGEDTESISGDSTKQDGKININQASREELMTLPGVGQSRAESIITYREEHGRFQKIEDIMNVSGIKEGLFEKIKDLITV